MGTVLRTGLDAALREKRPGADVKTGRSDIGSSPASRQGSQGCSNGFTIHVCSLKV